ncbi:MAG: hypothetical protein U0T84_09155 [Chitinophagales bacterium]
MKKTLTNLLFCLMAVAGIAQTNTWTGNAGSDWHAPANWSLGHVPTATEDVVIVNPPNGNYSAVVLAGNQAVAHNLTISASPCGVILYGALTVSGTITNHGIISIDNNNSGGLVQTAGSVYSVSSTGFAEFVYYDNNPDMGYRNICFPLDGTIGDLVTNSFGSFTPSGLDGVQCWYNYSPYPDVQVYSEQLNIVDGAYNEGWLSYTGSSNPLTPMKGVAFRFSPTSSLNFVYLDGTPRNGPQSIAIKRTPTPAHPTEEGWNFVGNPYPCTIDWPSVAALNPDITGSCYVFHATGPFSGYWGTINAAGVYTGGLTSATLATGQAFFIRKSSAGNGIFAMDNSVRSGNQAAAFKTDVLQDEVRLSLTDGHNRDEIVSYSTPSASDNYDIGLDAEKIPAGSTAYISFATAGKELSINALAQVTEATELPLVFWAQTTGNYLLSADVVNVTGKRAYLKDYTLNTLVELTEGMPLQLALTGGLAVTGRYAIVFKTDATTGIESVDPQTSLMATASAVVVARNHTTAATLQVFNTLGQELLSKEIRNTQETISLESLPAECLTVRLNDNGHVETLRIVNH